MNIERSRSVYKELLKQAYEEAGEVDLGWTERFKSSLCQRELMLSTSHDTGRNYPSGRATRVSNISPMYVIWIPKLEYISVRNYRTRINQVLGFANEYPGPCSPAHEEFIRDYTQTLNRAFWIAGLVLSSERGVGDMYPNGQALPLPLPLYERSETRYINWRSFTNRSLIERRIGCAAYRSKKGAIVSGLRHGSQDMRTSIVLRFDREDFIGTCGNNQGFIDNYGTYLDRKDAYKVAFAAGQILDRERDHTGHRLKRLFSEMIY